MTTRYGDRVVTLPTGKVATAKEVAKMIDDHLRITSAEEDKPVVVVGPQEGDIYRQQGVCPICTKRAFDTDAAVVMPKPKIMRIPTTCRYCGCVFQQVYTIKFIHNKIEVVGRLPEPAEDASDAESLIVIGDAEEPGPEPKNLGEIQIDLTVR